MAALRREAPAQTHNPLRRPAGKTPNGRVNHATPKYFSLSVFRIIIYKTHPNPAEGRIAIVTNAGWDVVDAGGVGAMGFAGRLTP